MKGKHVYVTLDCPASLNFRELLTSLRRLVGMSDGQHPNYSASTRTAPSPQLLATVTFILSVVSCLKYNCILSRCLRAQLMSSCYRFFPDTFRIPTSFEMHRSSSKCTEESSPVDQKHLWSRISYGVLSIHAGQMIQPTGRISKRFRNPCTRF